MGPITGKTLLDWGYKPASWFKSAIAACEQVRLAGGDEGEVRKAVEAFIPPPFLNLRDRGSLPFEVNLEPTSEDEAFNLKAVEAHMVELMRLPTVRYGAVMPDACPSGSEPGTIPVGGIIATEDAIHPGMHSADICCSMSITILGDVDPKLVLDAGMRLTHFGGGGRAPERQVTPPPALLEAMRGNSYLKDHLASVVEHFATQGDGNHFFYVGRQSSTGKVALVTHHGSRKPGAMLYKAGMTVAERHRRKVSPETPAHNAWLPASTTEGEEYWSALQLIREWTKANHYAIHDLVADAVHTKAKDRFWNEHNFVFRKSDGLFYHAKGATPAWSDFAADSTGLTIIPLNMAQPILIVRGKDAKKGLGFAPHGAGRNYSRGRYMKTLEGQDENAVVAEQTKGLDIRFFAGYPDLSELPGAYKSADVVREQVQHYGLADVVDTVEPIGCIMAGDWMRDAPWKTKK